MGFAMELDPPPWPLRPINSAFGIGLVAFGFWNWPYSVAGESFIGPHGPVWPSACIFWLTAV